MKQYVSRSRHPVDLADGRLVEPGGTVEVDTEDPHNKRLIEDGALIQASAPFEERKKAADKADAEAEAKAKAEAEAKKKGDSK